MSNQHRQLLRKPGLWFGFLFLVLVSACGSGATDPYRVGLDYCLSDTAFDKRNATEAEYQVFQRLILTDSSGHYMHAILDNGQEQWYVTLHDKAAERDITQQLLDQSDTVWQKENVLEQATQYVWQQSGIQRITVLLPQQRVDHLLQMDAFFESQSQLESFLQSRPYPNFIELCD